MPAPAHRTPPLALVVTVGVAAAVLLGLVLGGVVELPSLEGALENLAETLGPWTYALVAGMAFLETGAFIGLIAPARRRWCWAASWPPTARSRCRSCSRSPGRPPRWVIWRASCS